MRALSLTQPWSTFVALGLKTFETRDWGTDYRGPIAIHATREPCDPYYVEELLRRCGRSMDAPAWPTAFPTSAILCIADLVDVFRVHSWIAPSDEEVDHARPGDVIRFSVVADLFDAMAQQNVRTLPACEAVLGDLSSGRYGWRFENVRALAVPIPCRGRQRLWRPDERLLRQLEGAETKRLCR